MMNTNRPLALVTGASSGLGKAFVRQLAASGYDLLLVARRRELLDDLAEQVNKEFKASAKVLYADLSTEKGIQRVVRAIEQIDRLDLLINNAGFGSNGAFADCPVDQWLAMLSVHCATSVRLSHAALQKMKSVHSGSIINVSSVSAFAPLVGNAMYSATKTFLVNFSRSLQLENRKHGIHIQALCPGFFHSEFHTTMKANKSSIPRFFFLNADRVAFSSLAALKHDRVLVMPGLFYQVASCVIRIPGLGDGLLKLFSGLAGRWRREFLREG